MQSLSDHEAESFGGGLRFAMPSIQVSPNVIVNTVPQINAASSVALFGGDARVDQGNGSRIWNTLIASLFNVGARP
jgi:hypothetical protein